MSLKRVVLIAAFVALVSPAAAFADGMTFGFANGSIAVTRPFVLGGTATASAPMLYITKMLGNVPFGPATTPTFGTPPKFLSGSPATPNYFGDLAFTTGPASAVTGDTSATFDSGGSLTITSAGTFGTATGGSIPNGTVLFSGSFSGPTTMTYDHCAGYLCSVFWYRLDGPVTGTLDSSVMSYFGLGSSSGATGLYLSILASFSTPTDSVGVIEGSGVSVVVPEPGTLALFGTGLVGIAGFIRRRFKV
jgi:hypothetical protein